MIAVVIFGIFLSLSYFMFQDEMKNVLASVMDGVGEVTGGRISSSLVEPIIVPEVVLVPNPVEDFVFTSSTGTITAYNGTRKDVVIPSSINGVPVTVIGTSAFRNKALTSVVLPNSLVTVGTSAFADNLLTTIAFGSSLKLIGINAFGYNQLTSVEIPGTVLKVDTQAFMSNQLTSVKFNTGTKTLDSMSFYGNKLTHVEVPYGISIGTSIFLANPLTSAKLPTGLIPDSEIRNYVPWGALITRY